jgi:hypothetical protein
MKRRSLAVVALLVLAGTSFSASAARISCESRNYQRNYCSTAERIASVRLVAQQSRSPCIQGRTWGYDSGGIWVTQGCSAEFDYKRTGGGPPMPGPGRQMACASQGYQEQFCPSERRIARARLVEQRSRAACVQGQSWGFRENGIWVSNGCSGLFAVEERHRPPSPPSVNRVTCDSRDYKRSFCGVGPTIRRAWLQEQRSRARCVEGETWGYQRNGIWVDRGCSGVFAFDTR